MRLGFAVKVLRRDNHKTLPEAPLASQHADTIDAKTFVEFSRAVAKKCGRIITPPFDVMCEAKAKDWRSQNCATICKNWRRSLCWNDWK